MTELSVKPLNENTSPDFALLVERRDQEAEIKLGILSEAPTVPVPGYELWVKRRMGDQSTIALQPFTAGCRVRAGQRSALAEPWISGPDPSRSLNFPNAIPEADVRTCRWREGDRHYAGARVSQPQCIRDEV